MYSAIGAEARLSADGGALVTYFPGVGRFRPCKRHRAAETAPGPVTIATLMASPHRVYATTDLLEEARRLVATARSGASRVSIVGVAPLG